MDSSMSFLMERCSRCEFNAESWAACGTCNWTPRMYPLRMYPLCEQCEEETGERDLRTGRFLGKGDFFLPQEMVIYIQTCLKPTRQHQARMFYLRYILLPMPHSATPFSLLTYGRNGMAGNVNQYTDLIDLVLAFLVQGRVGG